MIVLLIHFKVVAAVIASIVGLLSNIPYLVGIFKKETKPHPYTWLIWTITTCTAAFGAWYGGGGPGAVSLFLWSMMTAFIFLLSLRFGTRNITKSDAVFLAFALLAVFFWWFLHEPLLAVLMATLTDFLGYFPTYRKSFEEPWSESVTSWGLFALTACLVLVSISEYSLITVAYLAMSATANLAVIAICLFRRRVIPKPVSVVV